MIRDFDGKSNVDMEAIGGNQVLACLQASPYTFTPTGSRLFGLHRPDSDFDFYVQKHPAVIEFLAANGFRVKPDATYYQVTNIYQVLHCENVDVLLVVDALMEDEVQRAVIKQLWRPDPKENWRPKERYSLIPKELRCIVWEVGYEVFRRSARK